VQRPVDKALGLVVILIGVGMIFAALSFGLATPWVTIAATLLGMVALRWWTRSKALTQGSKRNPIGVPASEVPCQRLSRSCRVRRETGV
jgi:hypothetical protein